MFGPLGRHMMSDYVLVKKSSLFLAGLAAAGLVGYHFYKHHHGDVMRGVDRVAKDMDRVTEEVGEVAKKGARKAKEVADEAKA